MIEITVVELKCRLLNYSYNNMQKGQTKMRIALIDSIHLNANNSVQMLKYWKIYIWENVGLNDSIQWIINWSSGDRLSAIQLSMLPNGRDYVRHHDAVTETIDKCFTQWSKHPRNPISMPHNTTQTVDCKHFMDVSYICAFSWSVLSQTSAILLATRNAHYYRVHASFVDAEAHRNLNLWRHVRGTVPHTGIRSHR